MYSLVFNAGTLFPTFRSVHYCRRAGLSDCHAQPPWAMVVMDLLGSAKLFCKWCLDQFRFLLSKLRVMFQMAWMGKLIMRAGTPWLNQNFEPVLSVLLLWNYKDWWWLLYLFFCKWSFFFTAKILNKKSLNWYFFKLMQEHSTVWSERIT